MMKTMAGGGSANTYIYTADDERIWTVDASGPGSWNETFTLRDLDGKVLRTFTTTTGFGALAWSQDYVHRDGQLLATARVNGATEAKHHFHLNHLGTPLLITRPDGGTEALHSYFPFGEELNPNADTERMKYTGHERDFNKTGQTDDLDYMHARYCSPMLGRFLAVDPKQRRTAQPRPQGWNRYAYALGNPLRMVDLDGKEAITFTIVTEIRASRVVAPAPAFPPLQAFNGGVKTAQRFTVETSATKSPEPIISSIGAIGETKRLSLNSDQVLERGRAPLSGLAVGSARDSDGNALVIAGASSANPLIPGAPPITYGFLIQAGQSGEGFTFSGTYGGFPSATVTATNESGQTVTVYEYDEANSPAGAFSLIPGIGDQTVNQTCSFGKAAGCEPTLQ
jgi:RHS repeat-associated protein